MFAAFGQKRGHPFPLLRDSVILASIKGSMQKELAVKAGLKGEALRGQDRKKKARFPQICPRRFLSELDEIGAAIEMGKSRAGMESEGSRIRMARLTSNLREKNSAKSWLF
jgi:hypothetical protein